MANNLALAARHDPGRRLDERSILLRRLVVRALEGGALGHGLPIGVGRALGLRIHGRDARVFVITGDGEINEGSVWEAALSASKHRLANLTLIIVMREAARGRDRMLLVAAGGVEEVSAVYERGGA